MNTKMVSEIKMSFIRAARKHIHHILILLAFNGTKSSRQKHIGFPPENNCQGCMKQIKSIESSKTFFK